MLNTIWPVMVIISLFYAFFSGNIEKVNNGIFESTKSTVEICLTFLGTISLWNGIMQIASKSKFVNIIEKILNPIINKLFPELKNNKKIKKEIAMNMIANILGIGNAATPLGLKAMKSMQEVNENKNTLSNPMMMFIVINTASIQLVPTTIIAIRTSMGADNPVNIVAPVWIATVVAFFSVIICTKLLYKFNSNNKKNNNKINNKKIIKK